MSTIENVSRRGFLKGLASAGAFVLCARFYPESAGSGGASARTARGECRVEAECLPGHRSDGTVYIVAHRSEMGTTSRTRCRWWWR